MPRKRTDGKPLPTKHMVKFTARFVEGLRPGVERKTYYDSKLPGLALRLEPSGHASYKLVYRFRGRPRWYNLGSVDLYPGDEGVALVREKCMRLILQMSSDKAFDPQAYRTAEKSDGSFAEDLESYLAHCATTLKSPEQKARLLRGVFLAPWETLPTKGLAKADVRHVLEKCKKKASSKDQAKAHLSAFFTWAAENDKFSGVNPCKHIPRAGAKINERARVVDSNEMPALQAALDTLGADEGRALRVILLSGQRPGDVQRMRHEDVKRETVPLPKKQRAELKAAGQVAPEEVTGLVWTQPRAPDAVWLRDQKAGVEPRRRRGWKGTKSGSPHSVWLPPEVADLIGEGKGPVFPKRRDLSVAMIRVSDAMGLEPDNRIQPHDLRRTFASTVTWAGFRETDMDRILHHAAGKVTRTYNRANMLALDWQITSAVVTELLQRTQVPAAGSAIAEK